VEEEFRKHQMDGYWANFIMMHSLNTKLVETFIYKHNDFFCIIARKFKQKPIYTIWNPCGNPQDVLKNLIAMLEPKSQKPLKIVTIPEKYKHFYEQIGLTCKPYEIEPWHYLPNFSLQGSRFKNVRNTVNAFKRKYPNHKVEIWREWMVDEAIEFMHRWVKQKIERTGSYMNVSYAHHFNALRNFGKELIGQALYVDNKMVGIYLSTPSMVRGVWLHLIGHVDVKYYGAADFLKVAHFEFLRDLGVQWINASGMQWDKGIEFFKKKYNPDKINTTYCTEVEMQ
jgi:hypothetical protein